MAKRRFLTLAAIFSCLSVLFQITFDLVSTGDVDVYLAMAVIYSIDLLLLFPVLWFGNTKEKLMILLPISAALSFVVGAVIQIVFLVVESCFDLVGTISSLLIAATSFVGYFLIKQETETKSFFSTLILGLFGLTGIFVGDLNAAGLLLWVFLMGFFFKGFPEKIRFIGHLVLVGILTALSILLIIIELIVLIPNGRFNMSAALFIELTMFLLGVAYFAFALIPSCKKLCVILNGTGAVHAEKEQASAPPAAAKAAAGVDPLDALEELQKLREAGALTEEEFAAQKNKILGGM